MTTRASRLLEAGLVTVGYTLVAIGVTWPLTQRLGSSALGVPKSDVSAGIWWYDALQATGFHLTGTTVFRGVVYPFGLEQANGLNLQWLFPNYPTFLLTKVVGEVAAFNIEMLSGLALSASAAYLLARVLGAAPLVAWWSGFAFLLFPWHMSRVLAGHASLVHLECIPLLAVALILVARAPSPRRWLLVAVAALLCWLTSGLFGVMAMLIAPVAMGAAMLVSDRQHGKVRLTAFTASTMVAVSAAVYVVSLTGGTDGGLGATRGVESLSYYGLRPGELVVPAAASSLTARFFPTYFDSRYHGSSLEEINNYLGWTALILAGYWLLRVGRTWRTSPPEARAVTAAAIAATTTALAFATPSPIGIGGHPWTWTPSRVLWEFIPAFRIPSRWTPVIFLGVLILATLGLQALWDGLRSRHQGTGVGLPALGLVAIVAIASFVEFDMAPGATRFSTEALPRPYGALSAAPPGAVAEYPLLAGEKKGNSVYLLWQRFHQRPLINGSQPATEAEAIRRSLVDPRDNQVAGVLRRLGAVAIITRPDSLSEVFDGPKRFDPPSLGSGFRRIERFGDGTSVWRIVAPPAQGYAFYELPEFTEPDTRRGRVVQYLVGPAGRIAVQLDAPFRGTLRMAMFARRATRRTVTVEGKTFVVRAGWTSISIPVSLPRGRSTLSLEVTSPRTVAGLAATVPTLVPG